MIRGNYSLAKEVRRNEQKSKQKIQLRQKHQSKLEQLSAVDPIRLYLQVERLEKKSDLDQFQQKKLQRVRQDWAFIKKNKLHEEKVNSFLSGRGKAKEANEKEQRRLRGKESVYFNPELNPLGKVPNPRNMSEDIGVLPNIPKPVKLGYNYEQDPLIKELNIKPPAGNSPQFYKNVQNIHINTVLEKKEGLVSVSQANPSTYRSSILDTDSDADLHSDT